MIRRVLSTIGGYGLSMVLTFVVGIVSIPVVTILIGPSLWAAIAVTQSIAAIASVVVAFGWTVIGPTNVASLTQTERPAYFWRSFQVRLLFFIAAGPAAWGISVLLTPLSPLASALAVFAYLGQALSGGWYYVGESRPFRLLLLDTLPRVGSIVIGLCLLAATSSVELYVMCLALGTLVTIVVAFASILRCQPLRVMRTGELLASISAQRYALTTTAAASLYSNSPLIVASIIAPVGLESFAYAFKVYNFAAAAFNPVVQAAQGWVPAAGAQVVGARIVRTVRAGIILSALAGAAMAVLFPFATAMLSAGEVDVPYPVAACFAIATAAILMNQLVGLACLPSIGRTASVAASVMLGASVGVPLFVGLAAVWGPFGLSLALTATELVVTAYQLGALRIALRHEQTANDNIREDDLS